MKPRRGDGFRTRPLCRIVGTARRNWRPAAAALGIGLLLLVAQSLVTEVAETVVSGSESEIWAAAIGELIMGGAMLGVLWRFGWLRLAAVTSPWRPNLLPRSGWTFVACLFPAVALLQTSWDPMAKIVALAVDYLATGFYEELAYRGLIFVFLARAWKHLEPGIVASAVVSGVIFGLVHFNPVLLVLGPLFAIAFSRLQLDTRTIWIPMLLHALFDWFVEFPFNADGSSNFHWSQVVALGALVVAGVLGFRSLLGRHHDLETEMGTGPMR